MEPALDPIAWLRVWPHKGLDVMMNVPAHAAYIPALVKRGGEESVRSDFILMVLQDGQRLPTGDASVSHHYGITEGTPAAGQMLAIVGRSAQGLTSGHLSIAMASVTAEQHAQGILDYLKSAGDVEGHIPFDPQAEILVETAATPGMSGSGAFDEDGNLVGMFVRRSDAALDGRYFGRLVRADFMEAHLMATMKALSAAELAAVSKFFE